MQRTTSQDSDSDEDVPDELKQDFVDEKTGDDAPSKRYCLPLIIQSHHDSILTSGPAVIDAESTAKPLAKWPPSSPTQL